MSVNREDSGEVKGDASAIDGRACGETGSMSDERSLRLLVETIPALVWRARADGYIDYVNGRVLKYLGAPLEEIAGWGWLTWIHPDDVALKVATWMRNAKSGHSHEATCRIRGADGAYRWFDVRGEPLWGENGRILSWHGILIDIDARKGAEAELRSLHASLSRASQIAAIAELSASIAHEINQPLTAIVANAETCRQWLSSNPANIERAGAAVERIVRDGNAATEIIRRVRALFRKAPPAKSPMQINDVIQEVWRLLHDDLDRMAITSGLDLGQRLPPTPADRIQIQQVLLNLIRNAIEAMEDIQARPKHLVVRSRCTDGSLVVEVCDTGRGLTDTEGVFESLRSTKHDGMGVGLAISRSIIRAHGGELWARSAGSAGTIFAFTLPTE